jgi:hypothetical protein
MIDALYGELDPKAKASFDEHIAGCDACARDFTALQGTLSVMNQRTRPEPDQATWTYQWNSIRARLEEEQPKSKIIHWNPTTIPAWAYAMAAMLLLAVGIYAGRTFFRTEGTTGPRDTTTASGTTGTTAAVTAPATAPDSATIRALAYLERSRNLLIGLTNLDESQHESIDLTTHQQASRELVEEGHVLTVALTQPDQQLLKQLIQDLQVILIQLANVEVRPGVPVVELVKKGVDDKSILLKINVEEMKAAARHTTTKASQKNTQKM